MGVTKWWSTDAVVSLTKYVNEREADWWIDIFKPNEAVQEAIRQSQVASRPVVIADTQDNPGAGGNSNTTGMLRALVSNQAQDAALGVLFDPEAAEAAHKTGIGKTITLGLRWGTRIWGTNHLKGRITVKHTQRRKLDSQGANDAGSKDQPRSYSVSADRRSPGGGWLAATWCKC